MNRTKPQYHKWGEGRGTGKELLCESGVNEYWAVWMLLVVLVVWFGALLLQM